MADLTLNWEALEGFDFWGYRIHPAAHAFPFVEDNRLEQIARSIAATGLRLPILVSLDGQLIDGRNRARALCLLGIDDAEALTRGWIELKDYASDAEILEEVAALNLDRRALTTGQEAMAAARLVRLGLDVEGGRVRDVVAENASVSARTIQDAKAVLERGCPQLIALVEGDAVKVYQGALLARRLSKERQALLLEQADDPAGQARGLAVGLKELGRLEPGVIVYAKRWDDNSRLWGWGTIVKIGAQTGKLQALAWPDNRFPDAEPTLRTCWPDEVTMVAKDVESDRLGARVRICVPSPGLPPEGSTGTIQRTLSGGRYLAKMDEATYRGGLEIREWLLTAGSFEVAELPAEDEEGLAEEPQAELVGQTRWMVRDYELGEGRIDRGMAVTIERIWYVDGEVDRVLIQTPHRGAVILLDLGLLSEEPVDPGLVPFEKGDEAEFAETQKGYPSVGTRVKILRVANLPPGMVRVGLKVPINGSYRPIVPISYLRLVEPEVTRDDCDEAPAVPIQIQETPPQKPEMTPAESDDNRAKEIALATGALVLETAEQVLKDAHKGLNRALKGQVNNGAWFRVEQEVGKLEGYTAQALHRLDIRNTGYPPDAALKVMRTVLAKELARVDAALNRQDHRDQLDLEAAAAQQAEGGDHG